MTTKKSYFIKKILTNSIFFLSVSSHSDCMDHISHAPSSDPSVLQPELSVLQPELSDPVKLQQALDQHYLTIQTMNHKIAQIDETQRSKISLLTRQNEKQKKEIQDLSRENAERTRTMSQRAKQILNLGREKTKRTKLIESKEQTIESIKNQYRQDVNRLNKVNSLLTSRKEKYYRFCYTTIITCGVTFIIATIVRTFMKVKEIRF